MARRGMPLWLALEKRLGRESIVERKKRYGETDHERDPNLAQRIVLSVSPWCIDDITRETVFGQAILDKSGRIARPAVAPLRQTDGWFMQEMIRQQSTSATRKRVCPRSN